jgi:hypothetical protein
VLSRVALARAGEPATVLEALPPSSRLQAPFPPPRLAPGELDCCVLDRVFTPSGLSPSRSSGRVPPVDFCNHYGSRARPRTRLNAPHASPGVTPLRCANAGSHAPCGAKLAEVSRFRGRRGRNLAGASRARDSSRGELCPETIGSDTSCHELVSTPGGVARRRIKERSSHEPAGGRRTRRRSR